MLGLIALALSVGLADSINPSTVAPALYLATGPHAVRRLVLFTLGAFAAYCLGGIVLTAGPGQAILAAIPRPSPEDTHLIEIALGGVALAVAAALWLRRETVAGRVRAEERRTSRSSFFLGAAIMTVELPTAFPYFAVIAAVVGSGEGPVRQLLIILIFNLAFVLPLGVITGLRAVTGPGGERFLLVVRAALDRHAASAIVGVTAILAAVLLIVGTVGLTS